MNDHLAARRQSRVGQRRSGNELDPMEGHMPAHDNDSEQTLLAVPVTRYRPTVKCKGCGARLTDSVSRRWGLGRECRRGLISVHHPGGAFDIDQEELPGL
ncbi:DUF6011 domain-containing protein [Streptomyces sp. NPDC001404]|uniref:DUF6011 domain-containing protein n=1 Tax=Streptomyces sp. NPDC001404 TaxID=3364571 RepID=UPI0036AC0D92